MSGESPPGQHWKRRPLTVLYLLCVELDTTTLVDVAIEERARK